MFTALLWPCCRAICIPWLWSSTAVASRLCIFCGCAAVNCLPFCCKTRIFNFILNTSVGPGGNWIQTLLRSCGFLTLRNCLSFLTSFFSIVGSPKWFSFISLENALWSWGNLNSILAASMIPMDGSTGSIAAWPKKVSLLVFGLKPRREKVADTWRVFHFLGVNFWEMIGLVVFFSN